jgi:hypothetical protein
MSIDVWGARPAPVCAVPDMELEKQTMSSTIDPTLGRRGIDVDVPTGEPAERLIANLILSVVACQLHSEQAARPFVTRAYELALSLSALLPVYRPRRPAKFARLMCEVDGEAESALYSVINDVLVVPAATPETIIRSRTLDRAKVKLLGLIPVRYVLRLRPRRIAEALEPLKKEISYDQLSKTAQEILMQCLKQELPHANPLEHASESFTLAHNLIGKKNYALAVLALADADSALALYSRTTPVNDHPPVTQSMRKQIAAMLQQMGHQGSANVSVTGQERHAHL